MQLDDDASFCARCGKPQQRGSRTIETIAAESQTHLPPEDYIDKEVARLRSSTKSYGHPATSHRSSDERIANFIRLFLGGVVLWLIFILLDFILRANSYYFVLVNSMVDNDLVGTKPFVSENLANYSTKWRMLRSCDVRHVAGHYTNLGNG